MKPQIRPVSLNGRRVLGRNDPNTPVKIVKKNYNFGKIRIKLQISITRKSSIEK